MPLVALALVATVLWWTNRAVTPVEATPAMVAAQAQAGGYQLLDFKGVQELYERTQSGLRLIDTRQDWEYRAGHIKGAENFPMESTRWSRWRKRADLAALLGPDKDQLLIFY